MDLIEKATKKHGVLDDASLVERSVEKHRDDRPTADRADIAAGAHPTDSDAARRQASEPVHRPSSRPVTINRRRLRARGLLSPNGASTRLAEEFRVIKRPLIRKALGQGRGAGANGSLIMVTSTRPNEGKTYTAINLAISIASERDVKVLLVDADLTAPSIPSILGITAKRGLVDVADDESLDLSDVLLRTDIKNLTLLPAGRQEINGNELLASERMKAILADLAQHYPDRIIILDSPPLLASSEPSVLALFMGQIVFVVEAFRTTETAVRSALDLISSCDNISFVLNKSRTLMGAQQFGSYYGSRRSSK